jgi:hypothetical protein
MQGGSPRPPVCGTGVIGAAPGIPIIGGGLVAAGVAAFRDGAVGQGAAVFCCFGESGHGNWALPGPANNTAVQNTSAASGCDIFPSMICVPSVGVEIRKPCESGNKAAKLDGSTALAMLPPRDARMSPRLPPFGTRPHDPL